MSLTRFRRRLITTTTLAGKKRITMCACGPLRFKKKRKNTIVRAKKRGEVRVTDRQSKRESVKEGMKGEDAIGCANTRMRANHTYTHTHSLSLFLSHSHSHTCTFSLSLTHTHICTQTHTHTQDRESPRTHGMPHTHTHTNTHTYTHTHANTHTYTHMHTNRIASL